MVAGLQVAHAGADRLDDPGGFVAEHERHGERHPVTVQRVDVAVAHAGGHDPDEDLADSRLVDLDVLDLGVPGIVSTTAARMAAACQAQAGMYLPPSITRTCPVTKWASSLAK